MTSEHRMLAFFVILFFVAVSVYAETERSSFDSHEKTGHHSFHRHHVALFWGATNGILESGHDDSSHSHSEETKRNTDFSIGGDYEFRIIRHLGVGALMDYTVGDLRTTVFAAGAFMRPVGSLIVTAAPGFESHDKKRHALFRLGFGYEFVARDRFSVTPNFNIDFVNGHQVCVFGAAVGIGF